MNKLILTSLIYLVAIMAYAQTQYPVINADNTATFSFSPPFNTDKVILEGSFGEIDMKRGNDGTWTATTPKPLSSDMHTYRFVTEDQFFTDPNNPRITRDITDTLSYFITDGWPGALYQQNKVPHGTVSQHWYPSSYSPDMSQRRLSIYLPPTYNQEPKTRFPVLYLLHGTGGDELAWLDMGRLAQIMDNMIAKGLCQPMIVVMPNGIAEHDAAPGCSPYQDNVPSHMNLSSWLGRTEAAFPLEVVPYIEQNFRVAPGKANHAIAGVSMGGMHAMAIACNNPEMFDFIGLFSPQTANGLTDANINRLRSFKDRAYRWASKLPFAGDAIRDHLDERSQQLADMHIYENLEEKLQQQFSNPPQLYYISIGNRDPLQFPLNKFLSSLDDLNANYYYNESSGGHTWNNWRLYLLDFLPRLFNKNQ